MQCAAAIAWLHMRAVIFKFLRYNGTSKNIRSDNLQENVFNLTPEPQRTFACL